MSHEVSVRVNGVTLDQEQVDLLRLAIDHMIIDMGSPEIGGRMTPGVRRAYTEGLNHLLRILRPQ